MNDIIEDEITLVIKPAKGVLVADLLQKLDRPDAVEEVNYIGERAVQFFVENGLKPLVGGLKSIHQAVGTAPAESITIKIGENSITVQKADLNQLDDVEKFAKAMLKQLR